ncbi:MAG: exodeoxyribonuclease V subunit alpha [Myxococcota bacterium]
MSIERWLRDGEVDDTDVRFGRALARGNEVLLPLAVAVSRSVRAGHVCLTREQIPTGVDMDAAFEGLAAPRSKIEPMVIDGGRVYLHRAFEREVAVAADLIRRSTPQPGRLDSISMEIVQRAFPEDEVRRGAAERAISAGVVVITGGPGTGKTSTVVRLAGALVELAHRRQVPPPRIRLLAPTGKAAARLAESVRSALQTLDVDPWVRARIPTEAMTIHRALALGGQGRPRYHRDHPWASDVVIVDEMSMVDLELMSQLLDAARTDATVIFLGDPNQLSSVEAGSVLADLESLPDSVFRLTESHRYASTSGIGALARAVLAGDSAGALALLEDPSVGDVSLAQSGREAAVRAAVFNHQRVSSARDPAERHRRVREHRVLCARRSGRFGVEDVNARVRRLIDADGAVDGGALLVRRNDSMVELFNGDLGVVQSGENPVAWFEALGGAVRSVPLALVPTHEDAFALTVHQSQGSEFDSVSIVLAGDSSALATRELLFTALTRARRSVVLYGSGDQLAAAVDRKTFRASGMAERLRRRS